MRIDQETGTELTGDSAAAAVQQLFARLEWRSLEIQDMDITPDGKKVRVYVRFLSGPKDVTLRLSRKRALEIWMKLGAVLYPSNGKR